MSRTPEQRAAKVMSGDRYESMEVRIARAIRAAENAALERAAKACEGARWGGGHLASDHIRSLKTKTPRKRKETK